MPGACAWRHVQPDLISPAIRRKSLDGEKLNGERRESAYLSVALEVEPNWVKASWQDKGAASPFWPLKAKTSDVFGDCRMVGTKR